jgi:hypothetical protein
MIQRHMRIVFWSLVVCILAMATLLFVTRQRARDRVQALADQMPIDAPYTTSEPVTLDLANDTDGSVTATDRQLALPGEVTARARALLDHLVAEYALPGSPHPLKPGAMVDEVFLVPLPVVGYTVDTAPTHTLKDRTPTVPVASTDPNALQPQSPGGELAIINLRPSFVNQHPSGVEVESLTLLSILGTLHANLPQIEQVRFLVDGVPRETLAGHADLLRTYPTRDTTTAATQAASQ